jgi:hypothetical protein
VSGLEPSIDFFPWHIEDELPETELLRREVASFGALENAAKLCVTHSLSDPANLLPSTVRENAFDDEVPMLIPIEFRDVVLPKEGGELLRQTSWIFR